MLTYTDASLPAPHLAAYTRISDDPRGLAAGVTRQRQDTAQLAAERFPELPVVLYEDNDRSAYSGRTRPAYEAMCDGITRRRVTAVVAWDQDRLLRLPRELEALIDLCASVHLTRLATTSGDLDLTTHEGQFKARILAAVAKKASDDTSRRVKRAIQARRDRGDHVGPLPYGITKWTHDALDVDPEAAQLVRDCYDRLLSGDTLTDTLRYARSRDANFLKSRVGFRDMMLATPILTPGERADLKALLHDPARRVSFNNERVSWLTGILTCDVCDARLGRNPATNKGRGAWFCFDHHVGIALTPTEDAVRKMILAVGRVKPPAPVAPPEPEPDPERARRLARLAELYVTGALSDAEWEAARQAEPPEAARAPVSGEAAAPEPHAGFRHSDETRLVPIVPEGMSAADAWVDWTVMQKHRYALSLLREVRVRRAERRGRGAWSIDRLDPRWRE